MQNGCPADFWYADVGDILCHPTQVLSYLQALATANVNIEAERNPQKKVINLFAKSGCSPA